MYREEEVMMTMTMYLSIVARVLWFYKDIFIQVLKFYALYIYWFNYKYLNYCLGNKRINQKNG